MSFELMAWAVKQEIPAMKKIVLLLLADRTNSDSGKCVPRIVNLAKDCGMSERSVRVSIKWLVENGYLVVHERFHEGLQLANQYELCISKTEKPTSSPMQKPHPPLHHMQHTPAPDAALPLHQMQPVEPRRKNLEDNQNTPPTPQGAGDAIGSAGRPVAQDGWENDILFDQFWKAYPKKVGKDTAQRAFKKRKVDSRITGEMLTAIEKQKQSEQWQKNKGQFIPNPATWLNQGRWKDEENESSDPEVNHGKWI